MRLAVACDKVQRGTRHTVLTNTTAMMFCLTLIPIIHVVFVGVLARRHARQSFVGALVQLTCYKSFISKFILT